MSFKLTNNKMKIGLAIMLIASLSAALFFGHSFEICNSPDTSTKSNNA